MKLKRKAIFKLKAKNKKGLFSIDWYPILLVTPAFTLIILLSIYPLLKGIRLSFYDWTLINPSKPFIGFDNYIELFTDSYFWSTVNNTLLFAILSVGISTIIGLAVALLLNKNIYGRGFYRAVTLIPWVTPSVIIAFIWWWLLSKDFSPLNHLLLNLNLIDKPIGFLSDIKTTIFGLGMPFWSVLAVRIWTSFTFKAIMFLSALQSIPTELYESASIDGANTTQKFRHITLPYITPVMAVTVSLSMIWNLSHFDYNYLMTMGGPFGTTNVMGVFVYQKAFSAFRFGYASTAGIIILLLSSVFAFIYMKFVKKEDNIKG